MQWRKALKGVGDWSKEKLREGLQSMLETWDEMERRLRRKMRVYPGTMTVPAQRLEYAFAQRRESGEPGAEQRRWEDARRKAIVSVNGRDLSSEDQIAEAHAQDAGSARSRTRKKNAA